MLHCKLSVHWKDMHAPGPVCELLQVRIGEQHKEAKAARVLFCNASQDVVPYTLATLQRPDTSES